MFHHAQSASVIRSNHLCVAPQRPPVRSLQERPVNCPHSFAWHIPALLAASLRVIGNGFAMWSYWASMMSVGRLGQCRLGGLLIVRLYVQPHAEHCQRPSALGVKVQFMGPIRSPKRCEGRNMLVFHWMRIW